VLFGCEGVANPDPPDAKQHAQRIERLVGWGYVVLQMDSFTPRGHSDIRDDIFIVSDTMVSHDAYAGKSYLSTLPFVDPNNVAVMGWSHGGWDVMRIIDEYYRDEKTVSPFKAAVAFYPLCHPPVDPDTPVLVLIGRKDDWCFASLAESLNREYKNWNWKYEFSLTVYPNATHSFDVEGLKGGVDIPSHHFDCDPQATSDAITRTRSFLAQYMRAQ
jgi:dienelactone hydrolase